MFLYRKDDNHPGVFSFAVRYAALALAFANARIMPGIAHGNLLLLFVLAAVYCLIDACLPVLAYQCGFRCSSKPVIPDRTIILFVLSTFLFAALDKP